MPVSFWKSLVGLPYVQRRDGQLYNIMPSCAPPSSSTRLVPIHNQHPKPQVGIDLLRPHFMVCQRAAYPLVQMCALSQNVAVWIALLIYVSCKHRSDVPGSALSRGLSWARPW
jgi:hypothetical protein